MALTEKQMAFARLLAVGKSQYEAYVSTYDTTSTNDTAIRANASKEANKDEVKAYVNQLRAKYDDREAMERSKDDAYIRALLVRRLEACEAKQDDTALARYIDIANKMNGTYVNITKDVTEKENKLDNLSVDELKALLNGK